MLETGDQPIDDPHRVLQVCVEQHEGEPSFLAGREEVRLAHFPADEPGHLRGELRGIAGGCAGVRVDHQQGEKILRSNGPLQLVVEHEVERLRGQHAGIVVEERIESHQDALPSSASLIL